MWIALSRASAVHCVSLRPYLWLTAAVFLTMAPLVAFFALWTALVVSIAGMRMLFSPSFAMFTNIESLLSHGCVTHRQISDNLTPQWALIFDGGHCDVVHANPIHRLVERP